MLYRRLFTLIKKQSLKFTGSASKKKMDFTDGFLLDVSSKNYLRDNIPSFYPNYSFVEMYS